VASPALDAEIAALDSVRTALAQHDSTRALHELDTYDRAFPSSMFSEEAAVFRIDALAQQNDLGAASVLARRFLSVNPGSAHAPGLRQWLVNHNL
jgi:outer membrane protein assembly factor BamD (BamD/ComL family)